MPALFPVRRLALIAALLPLVPAATLGASATISQNVNLRSGPSTSFGSVAELRPGETVDVSKCQGLFCYVTSAAGKGWVSAAYLTRDAVKPTTPAQIATTPPSMAPAKGVAKALPPRSATPMPPAAETAALPPKRAFPPAYAGNEPAPALRQPADSTAIVLPPADVQRPLDDFAAGNAPRPKADIPGGALDGPDDDFVAEGAPPDAAFPPPPGNGWGDRGWDAPRSRHFGRERNDFAALDDGAIGAARACLVDADGGPPVCLREGERLHADADWADRAFILRNPAGLEVTVCTDAPYRDCHVFMRSGPLDFSGGRSIASISVSSTPGY